jgi:hypothetical protein
MASDLLQRLRQRALSTASAKSTISTPEWNHFVREDIELAADRIEALEAQNAELFEMVKRAALIIPQHQENWHCDFYTMTHEVTP